MLWFKSEMFPKGSCVKCLLSIYVTILEACGNFRMWRLVERNRSLEVEGRHAFVGYI
jgi:hypothetical protein